MGTRTLAAAAESLDGVAHIDVEEALFTPELGATDPRWGAAVARMLAEYDDIRGRVDDVPDVAAAHALGEALHDHVRFEERELFTIDEACLDAGENARLEAALA
jgi:hypothetical protein